MCISSSQQPALTCRLNSSVMAIGYVVPLAALSTVLLSVASGLYSTLGPGSPTGWWVGFQILGGVGSGLGLQVVGLPLVACDMPISLYRSFANALLQAIIAIQAVVTGEELSTAMAFIVFTQSLGPAVVLTLCNLIFYTSLRAQLPQEAPQVDATAVINAGATGFREIVSPDDMPGVLKAYATSIDKTFYLVVAMAAACGLVLWGMGWKNLKAGQGGTKDADDGEKSASVKEDAQSDKD